MTRERFLARLRALDELNDEFVASVNEQRNNDTAQIIVVCEDLVRLLWFSIRDGGASLRQRDPAFSRALSQDWERGLIKAINTGQREYMQNSLKLVEYIIHVAASSGVHSLTAKSKVTPSA